MDTFLSLGPIRNFPYPIVDESGFKGKLGEINLETDMTDIMQIGVTLSKYGLKFSLAKRDVDILVISEVN